MRRVLFLLLAASACTFSSAQELILPDVLVTGDRALAIHDPILILGQKLTNLTVSDDGRYAVAVRETLSDKLRLIGEPEQHPERYDLVVWDSKTGRLQEIRLPDNIRRHQVNLRWMKGTYSLIAEFSTDIPEDRLAPEARIKWRRNIVHLDAANGKMTTVFKADPELSYNAVIHTSPTVASAILVETITSAPDAYDIHTELSVLRPVGSWTGKITVPRQLLVTGTTGWSPDGRKFLIEVRKKPEGSVRFSLTSVLYYDIETGDLTEVHGSAELYKPPQDTKEIVLERVTIYPDTATSTALTYQWWLKSPAEDASKPKLVVQHAELALLSPTEDYILYIFKGSLFVRRIQRISLQEYELILQTVRETAMNNAKQIAISLILYAMDFDNEIPVDLNVPQDLLPYTRNREFPQGFTYTFTGGSIGDIKSPATTQIGYIDTNYGRATAYLDGHVEWEAGG